MIRESREFKASGIYSINNKINNKIYIGSSKNIHLRISEHVLDLNKNIHKNSYLQNSWNKYGEDNFELIIVELCDEDILLDREQYWIDNFVSYDRRYGYNLHKDAKRHYVCEETRQKMRKRYLGKNNPRYGIKGCTRNKEQLKRHAISCSKPVIKMDKNEVKICSYKSIKEAAESNGICASNIIMCLKGKNKTCGGYKWKYKKKTKKNDNPKIFSDNINRICDNQSKIVFQKIKKSSKCFAKSEETRKKISEALKGHIPWNKGKKMTQEFCKKVSEAQMGRIPWNKGLKMIKYKNG